MYGHPIDFTNCNVENLIAVLAKVFNKGEKYSYKENGIDHYNILCSRPIETDELERIKKGSKAKEPPKEGAEESPKEGAEDEEQ